VTVDNQFKIDINSVQAVFSLYKKQSLCCVWSILRCFYRVL